MLENLQEFTQYIYLRISIQNLLAIDFHNAKVE